MLDVFFFRVTVLIFAKDFEVADEWSNGFDGLTVAGVVVHGEVDEESVFPFSADNGDGLDLREVDVVEPEDSQDLGQAAFGVRQGEYEGNFVDVFPCG